MNSYCKLDEWENFLERLGFQKDGDIRKDNELWSGEKELELRHWASTRGQTLLRTGSIVLDFFFCFYITKTHLT